MWSVPKETVITLETKLLPSILIWLECSGFISFCLFEANQKNILFQILANLSVTQNLPSFHNRCGKYNRIFAWWLRISQCLGVVPILFSYQDWPCAQMIIIQKWLFVPPHTVPLISVFHFPSFIFFAPSFSSKINLGNIGDINIRDINKGSPLYFRVNSFFRQLKLINGSYTKCLSVNYCISSKLKCHRL